MYYIINKTDNKTYSHEGSWPSNYLDTLLDQGNDIIVISLYSNTVKVVESVEDHYGEKHYNWKDYNIDLFIDLIKVETKLKTSKTIKDILNSIK